MDYPVIISGQRVGTLSVHTQGLFTVFEAEIPERSAMTRLAVFGGGREGYLGVMQPWSGGLFLRKKLSKSALAGFPENIEYAGEKRELEYELPQPAPPAEKPIPTDSLQEEGEKGLLWFASPSGVLTAFDGVHSLTAIPARLRRIPAGADIRLISGREYIVFRKY